MRSKIIISLGPKYKLSLPPGLFRLRKGEKGVLDLLHKFGNIYLLLFLGLVFSLPFFATQSTTTTINALYITVLILLGLQLIKKILSKGEHLPQTSYDLPLLFLTTVVAISLFIATAVSSKNSNIWGGAELRSISGVSIIAYWFLYYLVSALNDSRPMLRRSLFAFWLAPLAAVIFWLISFGQFSPDQLTAIAIMLPGSIWLLLTQNKLSWLHGLNIILSIIALFLANQPVLVLAHTLTFLVIFLVIVISKRNQLAGMFREADADFKNKAPLMRFIKQNKTIVMMLTSFTAVMAGVYYLKDNLNTLYLIGLINSFNLVKFNDLAAMLMGNGLNRVPTSKILQFINVYGLLAFAILSAVAVTIARNLKKAYRKTASISLRGMIVWGSIYLLAATFYLFLENDNSELLLLASVIILAFLGLSQRIALGMKLIPSDYSLREFKSLHKENFRLAAKIAKWAVILLLIFVLFYLLSSLKFINIFLSA